MPADVWTWLAAQARLRPAFLGEGLFGDGIITTGAHLDFPVASVQGCDTPAFAASVLAVWSALETHGTLTQPGFLQGMRDAHSLLSECHHVMLAALAGWSPAPLAERARALTADSWIGSAYANTALRRVLKAGTSAHESLAFVQRMKRLPERERAWCVHGALGLGAFSTFQAHPQLAHFNAHPVLRAVFS